MCQQRMTTMQLLKVKKGDGRRPPLHLEEFGPAFYCVGQRWQLVTLQPQHHQDGKKKSPAAPEGTPAGLLTATSADALIGRNVQTKGSRRN